MKISKQHKDNVDIVMKRVRSILFDPEIRPYHKALTVETLVAMIDPEKVAILAIAFKMSEKPSEASE